jgi:hypothetical protein
MTLYMLSYDEDNGDREDWNVFYTPVEAFSSDEKRKARIEVLRAANCDYEFHEYEIELDPDPEAVDK